MDTLGNVNNPSGQNPRPNGGTWQHQPYFKFRFHKGKGQYNPWDKISALRQQLQASHYHQNQLFLESGSC